MAIPSSLAYALALVAAALVRWLPEGRMPRDLGTMPLSRAALARSLRGMARAVLCSGSYVLLEVAVPAERLHVKVRLI